MANQGISSTSFPSFWRSPIATLASEHSGFVSNMPGSTDQEALIGGNSNEPTHTTDYGLTEHRTHQYINRPEGEMDMMIGFFLMNGFCVSFFLLFGLCVIFSCLRKRPAFFRRKQLFDAEAVLPGPEENSSFKPKLKSIVSQVIKSNKVTTRITVDKEENQEEREMDNKTPPKMPISRSPTPNRKVSISASRQTSFDHSRRCSTSVSQENSAMIRHNLLGPLSFDDLHYM